MDINQWDTYADIFNEGIGSGGDELHEKLINPLIFEFLGDFSNKTILDAACGNGYLINKLAPRATEVVGLDYSRKLLKYAKENTEKPYKCSFIYADLTKQIPLPDIYFDVVIANMVFQYLPVLEKAASEIARVLKKDGMFIFIIHHPGQLLFVRAQELIGKKSDKFLTSGSYFKAGKRTKKSLWNKAILEFYHRPVMDYINPFTKFFKLEKISEKNDDRETPRILGIKWQKIT